MPKYETTAGYVTRGDTYAQINEKLIELQELCYVMGHLHNTEDSHMDRLLGKGWLGVGDMMKMVQRQVIQLAKGHMQ